jgi:ElaB/YqjD/DUF883 family membrane-anchored ribosome-binding protein
MSPPLNPSTASTTDLPSGVPGSVSDPAIERMARGAHGAVDRMAGGASTAVERVRTGVQGAMGTMSDRMHDLQSSREVWVDSARERVREHPLATIGVALAAGYLLARILRS